MRRLIFGMAVLLVLNGCAFRREIPEKVRDLTYHLAEEELPERLSAAISERRMEPFKMLFREEGQIYLCSGYGEMPTEGYKVTVDALYLGEREIYFDTTLMGPGKGEKLTDTPSYPYVVVVTEDLGLPVVFE